MRLPWPEGTGQGEHDFQIDYRDLLRRAGEGESLELAGIQLAQTEAAAILTLERHPRDRDLILKVRLPLAKAEALYEHLGRYSKTSPLRYSSKPQRDVGSGWQCMDPAGLGC
jgi:hypothetical protein